MGGMTSLLLLLWLGVTVSTAANLHKRIIGGKECGANERQYHVKLILNNDVKNFCGGSLIGDQWILTAAHCVKDVSTITAHVGYRANKPKRMTVEINETEVFTDNGKKEHDIALLKLPDKTTITPVKLPECKSRPEMKDEVQIAGHAATAGGINDERICGSSLTLQCADVRVVNCEKNVPKIGYFKKWGHGHRFCGYSLGKDACKGDSGGGVVYKGMIYGVIVAVYDPYVSREPVIFMDVCNPEYFEWINKTIH